MTEYNEQYVNFKEKAVELLSNNLNCENSLSANILKELENRVIWFSKPCAKKIKKIQTIIVNEKCRGELNATSYKVGNIVLNLKSDWREDIKCVLAVAGAASSFNVSNLFGSICGIISCFISILDLSGIKISENETAIIIALQINNFQLSELQCKAKADEVLLQYSYPIMDENSYSRAIKNLLSIKSIKVSNKKIILNEKVKYSLYSKK